MDEKELSLEMEAKILKAATAIFIKNGKAGASMQDIADEAGINRTLLNYYFRSKDKLFEKVFEKVFLQFIPAIIERLNSGKPIINRFEDIIDYYFFLLTENPIIPIFIIHEIANNPDRLVSNIKGKGLNPSIFLSALKDEMNNGNLKLMDPRMRLIEVYHHVPAEDEIDRSPDRPCLHQIKILKRYHIPEGRCRFILLCVCPAGPDEILASDGRRN
jgi:TetR/AcrR family transcriptional regulator